MKSSHAVIGFEFSRWAASADLDKFPAEAPSGRLDVERHYELAHQVLAGIGAMSDDPVCEVHRVVLLVAVFASHREQRH